MSILLESMHTTFVFRFYCIFERFTYLLFLNEYTHMRKCVCLDTRLSQSIHSSTYICNIRFAWCSHTCYRSLSWVCPLNLTPSSFRRLLHSHLQPFHNITNTAHLFHSTHIHIIRKFHAQVLYQICGFISSLKKLHILFMWSKISIIFII